MSRSFSTPACCHASPVVGYNAVRCFNFVVCFVVVVVVVVVIVVVSVVIVAVSRCCYTGSRCRYEYLLV